MTKNTFKYAALIFAGLGLAACGGAANTNTANTVKTNSNTAVVVSNSNAVNSGAANVADKISAADKEFMENAAQGGMEEVRLGQLAATKAQNAAVKSFGQKMVEDHSNANTELKAIAVNKGVTMPTELSAHKQEDVDKLSKLSGAEFDKEYVRMMIHDHEKDVAEFQKQADGAMDADVKTYAAKTLPTLKSHYEMIKGIDSKMK